MDIPMSAQERANLVQVAAQRGMEPEVLLALAIAKQRSRMGQVKTNGWCPQRREFLDSEGRPVCEERRSKPVFRRRKLD
jgi:hypothetical protein